ncbi:hypothetical protein [Thermoactinomyces mirandus]|uniref:hypothetical protein n=1 Tax=Thermoactinomyces mirandus TaxID=2756294 RepID=UPI0015EE5814|nr:hypothetical protein [Thermoactinomyces mirandus]
MFRLINVNPGLMVILKHKQQKASFLQEEACFLANLTDFWYNQVAVYEKYKKCSYLRKGFLEYRKPATSIVNQSCIGGTGEESCPF